MISEKPQAYLLKTRLGPMAVLVKKAKLVKSVLPCETLQDLEQLIAKEWQTELSLIETDFIRELSSRIDSLWQGKREDFLDLPLDLVSCTAFQRLVYEELRRVPQAHVLSYGELARRIGKLQGARAVGGALGTNPLPLFIPCHRVLAKAGMGGFTAPGGLEQKFTLLRAEGFQFTGDIKAKEKV